MKLRWPWMSVKKHEERVMQVKRDCEDKIDDMQNRINQTKIGPHVILPARILLRQSCPTIVQNQAHRDRFESVSASPDHYRLMVSIEACQIDNPEAFKTLRDVLVAQIEDELPRVIEECQDRYGKIERTSTSTPDALGAR